VIDKIIKDRSSYGTVVSVKDKIEVLWDTGGQSSYPAKELQLVPTADNANWKHCNSLKEFPRI